MVTSTLSWHCQALPPVHLHQLFIQALPESSLGAPFPQKQVPAHSCGPQIPPTCGSCVLMQNETFGCIVVEKGKFLSLG